MISRVAVLAVAVLCLFHLPATEIEPEPITSGRVGESGLPPLGGRLVSEVDPYLIIESAMHSFAALPEPVPAPESVLVSTTSQPIGLPAELTASIADESVRFVLPPSLPLVTYPQPVESWRHPAANMRQYSLLDYRRMMINHPAPEAWELVGTWRGTNKGLATVAIDRTFIKEFRSVNGHIFGDNILVHQDRGPNAWRPRRDHGGNLSRQGKFLVQGPRGRGAFRHALNLDYSRGGNRPLDPANLVMDQVVKLDDHHMLGRASVRIGLIKIPLAFFVLERVH